MSASNQLAAFNYAVQPLGNLQIKNITAAYTVSPSDSNFILNCTSGVFTIAMPPASSLPSGFNCVVWNSSATATDVITIDPNGAETIDGATTLIVRRGEGTQVVCNGTNWETGNKKTMRAYSENMANGATRPVASGAQSLAIGVGSQATNTTDFAVGNGAIASGSASIALGRDAQASSIYSAALGTSSGVAGARAVGSGAVALGGSYASGTDSFAAGVGNNTSTYGATGSIAVALGSQAKASGSQGVALGNQASASGANSFAVGYLATASGNASIALSAPGIGYGCYATQDSSVAIGDGARSGINGKYAYTAFPFASSGDSQTGIFVLRRATTDATATVLTTDNTTASTTNQVILPNNSAYAFSGTIIARQKASAGNDYAAWEIKGAILRAANAASTVLGSYNINVLSKTAGASAWDLTLSADTTNGGLAVTATGAATTNIRWVATIKTSEVTYA